MQKDFNMETLTGRWDSDVELQRQALIKRLWGGNLANRWLWCQGCGGGGARGRDESRVVPGQRKAQRKWGGRHQGNLRWRGVTRSQDCHTSGESADRKEATGLGREGAIAAFAAAVPTASCGWKPDCRRQTVCQHLELVLSFQSVKSKTETHLVLTATQKLHLQCHLGLTSELGLLTQAGRLRVYHLP